MTALQRTIDGISIFLGIIAGGLLFYLIFGIGIDVFLRAVTGRGIPAVAEYADIVLVGLVYLSLARTQMDGGHVASDLVAMRLPFRARIMSELLGMLAVLAVLAAVTWYATSVAITSFERGEYRLGLTGALIWPARWAIVVGLVAWQLQLFLRVIRLFQGLRDGDDSLSRAGSADATI